MELVARGVHDLRGQDGPPLTVRYGPDAAVVVAGLPGSGKSTLLHRWDGPAPVLDPRTSRLAARATVPDRLPYPVYRPVVRTLHLLRIRAALRRPGPLLVHDCGSRRWMRRALARWARQGGRELHVVLLAVRPEQALAGQHARARTAAPGVFRHHVRGLTALVAAVEREGLTAFPGAASVLLADGTSRGRLAGVRFQ
ncbi:AAA family ATPase [Kitasatospora sp. CB01950]|uniref:AAA family ATPase n=1 Tax=Kitasatospora sp. CB01950 TaxID=1703930 RepID=UPI00093D769A|nr:AAA family ATPase [Kitasatospora sp. CB01950]